MRIISVISACLAYIGHSQQGHGATLEPLTISSPTLSSLPEASKSKRRGRRSADPFNPLRALARLFLAQIPGAAFNPASPGIHFQGGPPLAHSSAALLVRAASTARMVDDEPPSSEPGKSSSGGLRLLEWIPSQKLLVSFARFFWTTLWRVMLSELAPQSPEGAYVRPAPQLGSDAHWPDGLPMVAGRYHVYVGNACPWCHRVTVALTLRGLQNAISVSKLADDPQRARRGGWCFESSDPDPLLGAPDLKGVYDACTPGEDEYKGRCTAPLLVDLETCSIISNESGDIIRMLNELKISGDTISLDGKVVDLYPEELRADIDQINEWVYENINNGVYRAGFATKQAAYEEAERAVHASLERCDKLLSTQRFLCGEVVTEADVRLLPTAVRFDGVYASFFRCGRKQLRSDYPHVSRWMKDMLRLTGPGLFDLGKARESYYGNLFPLNPGGIVPAGPTPADLGMPEESSEMAVGPAAEKSAFAWRASAK